MDLGSHPALFIAGGLAVLTGILIRWRVSRYDLREMVTDSAWQLVRGRRTAENPTDIERKFHDIAGAATVGGKARRVTGSVIGHFFAQFMSIVGLILILGGGGLVALGFVLR